MSDEQARDAGYDDFIDSVEEGSPYYLECEAGHGSLPPRMVCPDCGNSDLEERDLPSTGSIVAHNVVHVPTPRFKNDTPYATAIVDFGPVSLTGQVRNEDPQDVENGQSVTLDVDLTDTNEDRVLVFDVE